MTFVCSRRWSLCVEFTECVGVVCVFSCRVICPHTNGVFLWFTKYLISPGLLREKAVQGWLSPPCIPLLDRQLHHEFQHTGATTLCSRHLKPTNPNHYTPPTLSFQWICSLDTCCTGAAEANSRMANRYLRSSAMGTEPKLLPTFQRWQQTTSIYVVPN